MRTTFLSAAMLLIAFIGIGTDSAYAAKRNSNNATTKQRSRRCKQSPWTQPKLI